MPAPLRRELAAALLQPTARPLAQGPIARAVTPAPAIEPPPVAPGEQLFLFEGEGHELPCNVQLEVLSYELKRAIVRRQSDEGGMVVLAHVGRGALQPFKRWKAYTEPSERKQIVNRIERLFGPTKVLK